MEFHDIESKIQFWLLIFTLIKERWSEKTLLESDWFASEVKLLGSMTKKYTNGHFIVVANLSFSFALQNMVNIQQHKLSISCHIKIRFGNNEIRKTSSIKL